MSCIQYKEFNFRDSSLALIDYANEIVEDYISQGYKLTLRQLYYQFVSRDIIPNNQKQYNNLGVLINNARLAGLLDWCSIEDRTRNIRNSFHWQDPKRLLNSAVRQFSIDKWAGQRTYVEVWVEKDALVEVVGKSASKYDVPYFSCRGYVSQSEMWSASERIKDKLYYEHEKAVIIHLGDHDPSGKDMTRDIDERLKMFLSREGLEENIEVERVALEMEQILKYNPPPNPAKLTDSRCGGYISEYGDMSWELDALEPRALDDIICSAILEHLDLELFKERKAEEEKIRLSLFDYVEKINL